jgi:C4-dicarboxylate transporter DctM subunit
VASAITGLSIEEISKPIIPMVIILVVTLILITYLPSLVLFLPNMLWNGPM